MMRDSECVEGKERMLWRNRSQISKTIVGESEQVRMMHKSKVNPRFLTGVTDTMK